MATDSAALSSSDDGVVGLARGVSKMRYRPVPDDIAFGETDRTPVWRVRFALAEEPEKQFGLDINGEIIFGRNGEEPNLLDLSPYDAGSLGVSRQHLMLRPTPTHLYAIDMGSTNGTRRNGRSIGFNSPSRLVNGDIIALGKLQLVVNVIDRPTFQTALLSSQPSPNLADALSQIAKAVTSQLELDEVLNQVTETAMVLTAAGETSIWLVDETSGDLFLRAERGIEEEEIQEMRLPIGGETLAGKVIQTGKPLYTHRQPGEDQIKVKTHYLVEALLYVPIKIGGVTLGVLSAVHRQGGKQFNKRDERLLMAIADFAAIAIQNARLYEATDEALQRRVKELSALNEVSRAVSASLDLAKVYDVLVKQVNRHWPVEAVHLYLLDERDESLQLHPSSTELAERSTFEDAITAKVARTGEAVVATNEDTSSSMAGVPLRIQEKVVGVLALLNKGDGAFSDEDVNRLIAFANPVATAIQNAKLFAESERQRSAILATAQTLSQPLIIIDDSGQVLVSNESADEMLRTNMGALFEGISSGLGRTSEIAVGEETYLSTAQHLPEVGTIAVMQDITYVKQLEQDRSEFMHALSHDLKSPLTSIMGWAQLLEKVVTLDDRGSAYVNKLVASAERMLDLINQMLQTVARGDTVEVKKVPCNMADVVRTVLGDAEGSALNKSIALTFEESGRAYQISADETRLYHMVLNLVDNAIKYSPNGTTVAVNLDFSEEGVELRVRDEGSGIPEQDISRLFDKYYRGTAAKIQPGAGLGLSVVWAIAEAHGGRVSVDNRPKGGAEFIVSLPGNLRLSTEKLGQ
jgi:signal transduction histidine kinase